MPHISGPHGNTIHYVDFDFGFPWEEKSKPVVLIPGLGVTWRIFIKQIPWLVQQRRVIIIDLRGTPESPPAAQGWTTADMAADLYSLVEHLGLSDPVIIGMSLGGTVALQYALDYPTGLSQLVTYGSPMGLTEEMREQRIRDNKFIHENPVHVVARTRMVRAFSDDVDPRLRTWVIDMISQCDTENYRSLADSSFAFDIRDRLSEIKAQTTVIHSANDRTIYPSVAEIIHRGIPNSTLLMIPDSGHFANLEKPEVFNRVLGDALNIAP
jgi:pimeloyl-ACP methyl ester carboxylesterase